MFQRAAARLPAPESASRAPVEGVVLIFDSADGGMASATVTTLREWDNGRLSDELFESSVRLIRLRPSENQRSSWRKPQLKVRPDLLITASHPKSVLDGKSPARPHQGTLGVMS